MNYPEHLLKLIQVLKKLPGIGTKSAERFAFQLLTWPEEQLEEFGVVVGSIKKNLHHCQTCGCLMGEEGCLFCHHPHRDKTTLCIIASARDVFSLEDTHEYQGLYHVLGGLLSPLHQRGPNQLSLKDLKQRIIQNQVKEVIVALDSTIEGDVTSLYLKQELAPLSVHVSRLAFGIPMGSSLDYVDGGTLARALSARGHF